ncbi:hypothetical protein PGB90_002934 [Kerria lacca]
MDGRNGDCFDHDPLFGPISTEPNIDHTCLKDYLLEPSTHDKIGCDGICFSNTKPLFESVDSYGCSNGNMITHASNYLNMHNSMDSFLPHYNVPNCTIVSNTNIANHYNNNNLSCNDFVSLDPSLPYLGVNTISEAKILQQPIIHEANTLVNKTTSDLLTNFNKNIIPDPMIQASSDGFDLIGNNNSNFMASPLFSGETLPVSKMDSDPFSPSISSSVSSIPSVEMADKSSYVPGSVDSGVVVNGSSSSPFSTSDSNRNGECSSINDSLISPLTQGPGSERSVETTPGSESISSELCSPRVDFEMLSLELNTTNNLKPQQNNVKIKGKSHKGRKRKNETKKEKTIKTKKQPVIVPTYQSQISPSQNGIKLKISLATPGPLPVNKRRRKHKKQLEQVSEPLEQSRWGSTLPEFILQDIFRMVTETDGCLPSLFR